MYIVITYTKESIWFLNLYTCRWIELQIVCMHTFFLFFICKWKWKCKCFSVLINMFQCSMYVFIYVYLYFPELPVKNPLLVLSLVALWIYRLSQISFEHCEVQQTLCENEFKNRSFFNRLLCWKSIGCVENFTHVEYACNLDAQTFFW